MSPVRAAVALGSNVGDRRAHLAAAVAALRESLGVRVLAVSDWIETEPVGGPSGQGPYLNCALLLETTLAPRALLETLRSIEARAGRVRTGVRDEPRTLDLDLVAYGTLVLDEPDLVLPHPRAAGRRFVLEPLASIAPDVVVDRDGSAARVALERLSTARLDTPAEARAWCDAERARGRTIGFVPTMGALHEGHLELVRRAARENDRAVVSVFVNPLQFTERADFERYPRDFARDVRLLAGAGAAMAFTGTLAGFFPGELDARGALPGDRIVRAGPSAEGLEGAFRPGHFDGVATIVARLFDVVRPTRAYFGEKDFQQTLVVKDLVRAHGGPPIVVCPTSREPSGLARSSRNELLAPADREEALAISRALRAARSAWSAGERDAGRLVGTMRDVLGRSRLVVEYAAVRDPERWSAADPSGPLERAQALVAARAGLVRLIDNARLDETAHPA